MGNAQDSNHTDYDSNKAKYLGNKDDMQAACSNFHEAHLKLITDLEDYFNNQVQAWRTSFFERHKEAQYHRNRQRIMDTKKVIDDCRDEIKAAVEAGEATLERTASSTDGFVGVAGDRD